MGSEGTASLLFEGGGFLEVLGWSPERDGEEADLTIVVNLSPARHLLEPSQLPHLVGAGGRVLETLLDLDALIRGDVDAEDADVADGDDEGLVAAAVAVVDVLAYDLPVGEVEDLAVEDGIGVGEAVEDEPGRACVRTHCVKGVGVESH